MKLNMCKEEPVHYFYSYYKFYLLCVMNESEMSGDSELRKKLAHSKIEFVCGCNSIKKEIEDNIIQIIPDSEYVYALITGFGDEGNTYYTWFPERVRVLRQLSMSDIKKLSNEEITKEDD